MSLKHPLTGAPPPWPPDATTSPACGRGGRALVQTLREAFCGGFVLLVTFATVPMSAEDRADDPGIQDEAAAVGEPAAPTAPDVPIGVTGMGWWKNRELRQMLRLLESDAAKNVRIDVAFIEDAVVLLQSALERDGYLRPSGVVRVFPAEGEPRTFAWDAGDVPVLPRDLEPRRIEFELVPGVRYHFEELTFTGLTKLKTGDARSFFIEEGFIFGGAATHRFTRGGLRRGLASLREQLVRMGHADARVEVAEEQRDDTNGDVRITIAVEEGPVHRVGEVTPPSDAPAEIATILRDACHQAAGAIDSPLWQQDFVQAARAACYAQGHASADITLVPAAPAGEVDARAGTPEVRRDYQLVVRAGPQVRLGTVTFAGDTRTSESVLRRATRVEPGGLFLRSEVERDRVQLSALGAFRGVRAIVDPTAADVWDLTYQLRPAKRAEASVLFGYGSYEKLRGGLEVLHNNLFGRAHRGRLQLVVSQKSTSGDYLYTVPQIFGTTTDASVRVFGLQREEVSFDREELGVSIGARRRLRWLGLDAALRYQYESVTAEIFDPDAVVDVPTDSRVGSLTLDLTRDRLDNPIAPHRGYLVALSFETAARAIGGEVDYQRLDWRMSWHRRVGAEKYVHIGLRHGVAWALTGDAADELPLTKRFFPGGEGTVRGYIEGRASPRAADGTYLGAEVSTVLNLEFEQGLTKDLSAVVFVDAGLTAARIADYPANETRVSVGLGLRYNSVIGPARLEYGHNVVREDGDGRGAWHLALGFPF